MRYTPTLKLSTRLAAFVTLIVTGAIFILFIGGALSFKQLGTDYLDKDLTSIANIIDKEIEQPDSNTIIQKWLPVILKANNIVEMELVSPVGVIYQFKNTSLITENVRLYSREIILPRNSDYKVLFKVQPPYIGFSYSFNALWSITLAVGLIVLALIKALAWLQEQLIGSELLEERGRMILAGKSKDYSEGDEREWPYTASLALDSLIEELQDARQERSRFDTFIRTQTFLDKLTGTANRVLFDSKLESALNESDSQGGVLLLRIEGSEQIKESGDLTLYNDFLIKVGEALSNVVQCYPSVTLSRYYESDFALLTPHYSSKNIKLIASQCIKRLETLSPPAPLDEHNWCHIGVTYYQSNEQHSQIFDEVEMAVRSAQLQKINTWTLFKKQLLEETLRGSVRWRTLFDDILSKGKLLIYKQPCYLEVLGDSQSVLHHEIFVRINDPQKGITNAASFISAIEQVGYQEKLDRAVFCTIVNFLKASSNALCYSLNINTAPFANKNYFKWFRDELLQLSHQQRSQLSFEFIEINLIRDLDSMRKIITLLSGLGCQVIVDQVGENIVSTHYIKDLNIHYLKLHRSLVKDINLRHENQLFVRSLLGACSGTQTKVIAVGVENKKEHRTLIDIGINGTQGRYFAVESQFLPPHKHIQPESIVKPGKRNRWRKR